MSRTWQDSSAEPGIHLEWNQNIPWIWVSIQAALFVLLYVGMAFGEGAPAHKGFLDWTSLPELPQVLAGRFVGTYDGALIVAGGSRLPAYSISSKPEDWSDAISVLEEGKEQWQISFNLPWPRAYGASVSTSSGLICIGGRDSEQSRAEVIALQWRSGKVETQALPSLPKRCAFGSAALLGMTIYMAGGQESLQSLPASNSFWSLELSRPGAEWQELRPWPGPGRVLPALAAQDGALYLFSGAELLPAEESKVAWRGLKDAYRFLPGEGWQKLADMPRPAVGAPAVSYGQSHILVLGGYGTRNASGHVEENSQGTALRRDILAYHTITSTWTELGRLPESLVTTTATQWQGDLVIVGGVGDAERRSGQIFLGQARPARSFFGPLNYGILITYLILNLAIGARFAGRQRDTRDFFLCGQRIPWWAAGIAICGTQLSTLTFMAIPAKTYATNWVYILVNACIPLVAPVVVFCYLPFFRRLNITSAYEYLEKRFNLAVRLFGSATFVLLQTGRMAIVLFLPSLALSVVSDLNLFVCILGMGVLSTLYTTLGGAEAVTWTEVLQAIVLFGSAILTLFLIAGGVDGGFGTLINTALEDEKLEFLQWSWDFTITSVWVVLLGNFFAQLIPYTTDQAVIQRYLSTPDEKQAARALWVNALITIPSSLLFFGIGTALYGFYKHYPQLLNPALQTDAIFPWFIVNQMPAGVSGLVIAGLFAAGQSGSQSSGATAIVTDFYRRFHPAADERHCLRLARWLTLLLGMTGMGTALMMAAASIRSLWDVFLMILGLFGASLAGVFALGIFTRRAHATGALLGALASVLVLVFLRQFTRVHFFLYAPIGILTGFWVGYFASILIPARPKNLEGLTIFTKSSITKVEAKFELAQQGNR